MSEIVSYILLWAFFSAMSSTLTGGLIMYYSKGKNPFYILAMTFGGASLGLFLAGIYLAFTWGLDELQAWTLMIPIVTGAFLALMLTIILPKALPKVSMHTAKLSPLTGIIALIVVVGIGFVSILPALPVDTGASYIASADVDYFATNYEYGGSYGVSLSGTGKSITYSESSIQALMTNPILPMNIDSVHTSIDYPRTMANDPNEGDTMGWRITFSVALNSPSPWTNPAVCIMYWGDVDGNGQYDSGEPILIDENGFCGFTATPTASTPAYWRAAAVWQDGTTPAIMMYNIVQDGTVYLLPIHYASSISQWKDDNGKTFNNLESGYTAPYDQWSWNWDTSPGGSTSPMESITTYKSVSAGSSTTLEGKLYCPGGMAAASNDWYLRVLIFDIAYDQSNPVNTYDMHFSVGGGGPGPEPPIVDPSGDYWIAVASTSLLTIGLCYGALKYGPKLI